MKKQTKTKKSQKQTKMAVAMNRAVVVHSRRQRFFGVVALTGLFFCGFMVGIAINTPDKQVVVNNGAASEPGVETKMITEPVDVCVEVERLLSRRLPEASDNVDDRIGRAKVFTTMAERGCVENSATYAEMARQELDIARAIENDDFSHQETIDVVETYKRLHMQAAAEEIFEKAKKLTNPAIDFILQVEKIINE